MTYAHWLKPAAAVLALALLTGCEEDGRLSRGGRHLTPVSPQMVALMAEKGATKYSPILLRAYKQESELEIWKQNASGEYVHLKTYPMCRWSGQLGPKTREGDRQVPEGFYSITPGSLNPNSSFYLSFNVGYPNAYDRVHGRNGALIMVHGACSSAGCFSMTDEQIAEIYAITREAFAGGQKAVQMQSLPFRFTPQNLAKYRADPNMPFWKMLKEGADTFEVTRREPQVAFCERKYAFNRSAKGGAADACSPNEAESPVVQAVAAKARADEQKVAELSGSVAPVRRIYKDGDQHHSFKTTQYADASADGRIVAVSRGAASRVADVSRPDALDHGPVDVPVEQLKDKGKKTAAQIASSLPAEKPAAEAPKVAASVAAPVASAPAVSFAPAAPAQASSSLFRGWLGGAAAGAAKSEAVPAVEPEKPQLVKIPVPPKAPQRQALTPADDKQVDAGKIVPEATALKGFTAYIPGFR